MNVRATPPRTEAETDFVAAFEAARADLPGNAAIADLRAESFATFAAVGLPNRRIEAWHYSDLRGAMTKLLPLALHPSAGEIALEGIAVETLAPRIQGLSTVRLVLVDGVFVKALSEPVALPAGIRMRPLAMALGEADDLLVQDLAAPGMGVKDPAIALNAAFMQGGIVIDIEAGAAIDMPIEIVSIATEAREQAFYSRSLVRLGAGARLNLIETQVSVGEVLSQKNDMLIVRLGDDAVLDHVVTAPCNAPGSVQVSSLLAQLSARSIFNSFAFVADAAFLRRQTFLRFDGEHGSASLSGVSILGRREHADTTLVVEHVAPNCKSREAFKHIVEGSATGVFQGRIVVAPGAQKTDGSMSSRAILLSEDASMYNKPELEIFADDVVCGHGATCGELDEDLLFYAMSRGLPRAAAESLLLEAFAGEVVDAIANETLRESLMDRVRARLSARRSS